MFRLTKSFTFDAAHRLRNHKGKCKNLHGHTWRVDVEVSGDRDDDGMVLDFGDLKAVVGSWIDSTFDHSCIVACDDRELLEVVRALSLKAALLQSEPTCENLAVHLFDVISYELREFTVSVASVTVHEGPESWARWPS